MAEPVRNVPFEAFSTPTRAPKSWKIPGPWLIMLLSGLVAFVAFIAVTQQNRSTIRVAVAGQEIAYGTTAGKSSVQFVDVFVSSKNVHSLIRQGDFNAMKKNAGAPDESVATRTIPKGEFLFSGDFSQPESLQRTLSFSIDPADANAGDIRKDNLIDIFDQGGNEVGHQLKVVAVTSKGAGTLGTASTDRVTITVAVPNEQVSSVVRQTIDGKFKVVKNNNNPPVISGIPGSH